MLDNLTSTFQPLIGPKVPLVTVLEPFWMVLLVSIIVSVAATPIARRLAFRMGVLDIPNDTVKTHKSPTAYFGGLAVLIGLLAGIVIGGWVIYKEGCTFLSIRCLIFISLGAVLATIVGLVDDIYDIKPWQKLIGQGVCSLFVVLAGIKPDLNVFCHPLGCELPPLLHDVLSYFTVLFFVLGASNSLNLLDGLDGLCTGVTAIITLGFMLLAIHLATWASHPFFDPIRIVASASLFGAAMGFLVFNRHPANIFLGDAGSILLGYVIAVMMMMFAVKNPRWWFASAMIFGLPILDTGTALIRRALNKRPLFVSDRGHIYDQMIDRGMSLKKTVMVCYLLAGLYSLLGLAGAIFVRTTYVIFIYLAIGILSFVIIGWKGYFRMSGLRGAVQKQITPLHLNEP
jgi:UDP-GlcNAc:undecaprenyl-phosphate GlcNAc-1-phosphate transferase